MDLQIKQNKFLIEPNTIGYAPPTEPYLFYFTILWSIFQSAFLTHFQRNFSKFPHFLTNLRQKILVKTRFVNYLVQKCPKKQTAFTLSDRRLRGGRKAEVLFPYSKLHKSFEKGAWGKTFSKVFPQNNSQKTFVPPLARRSESGSAFPLQQVT